MKKDQPIDYASLVELLLRKLEMPKEAEPKKAKTAEEIDAALRAIS